MIRFVCAHCAKPLRAPQAMAGKKGRCAQCNGVNLVPIVTSVDVKRVTAPTPFRDADVPVRGAIEKVVELAGVRFAATAPASGTIVDGYDADHNPDHEPPRDFFDHIAPRLGTVAEEFDADAQPPPPPPPARLRPARDAAERYERYQRVPADVAVAYEMPHVVPAPAMSAAAAAHVRRAVAAAMVVGAILGFCVGLLASKWIL